MCADAQPGTESLFCFMVAASAVSDETFATIVLSTPLPPTLTTHAITQWCLPVTHDRPPLTHILVRLPQREK